MENRISWLAAAFSLQVLVSAAALAAEPWTKPGACGVHYSTPKVVPLENRVIIDSNEDPAKLEESGGIMIESPQGSKVLTFKETPNFSKPGPWNTTLAVFGWRDKPFGLTIQFKDHGNNPITANWLNEKLIFMRVWWGRLVSTDLILDIESAKFMYSQEANYGNLTGPCDEKAPRNDKQRRASP